VTNQSAKLTLLTIAFLCSSVLIACLSFSHQAILLVPSVVILLALFPLIALNSPSLEGPSNHQDVSPLEESILGYMNDDNAHYAISLYGEWGSGKTWFCDNRLKGLLKQNGFSLCRVSLFGVESYEVVSSRIFTALLSIDESGPNRGIKNIKRFASRQLSSSLKSIEKISKAPVSLDSSALLNVIPRKNCLLVLDDIERSPFFREHGNSFGIINELCENQRRKVLLITGLDYLDEQKEQLEKVVWRKYLYTPSPESLFEATLAREISLIQKCDLDVKNAIIGGIEQSGILNARAIIKARPSLVAIASSTALRKQEIDHSERECALSKAIELAILVSANALPEVKESSDSMGKALIMIQLEGYEYLQEAFEPLTNGSIVNKNEINESLSRFIESKHNRTKQDIEIDDALSQLMSIREMDNDEAVSLALRLSSYVQIGKIRPEKMKKVYDACKILHSVGLNEAPSEQQIRESFDKTIESNPYQSRSALIWGYQMMIEAGEPKDPFLDSLSEKAESSAIKQLEASLDPLENPGNISTAVLESLENHSSSNKDAFIPAAINAETIAKAFESGNGKIQMGLIDFFELKYSHRAFPYNEGIEQSYKWLGEIIEYLGRIQTMEKLEEWRRKTFIDTLSKIRSDIGKKRQ